MHEHTASEQVRLAQAWRALGRAEWTSVVGWSMWPLLRPGDAVCVTPLARPARPGALLLFLLADGLVVHRVRAVTADGYQTQGDNQCRPDPPVAAAAVLGQITARRRGSAVLRLDDRRGRLIAWLAQQVARPWRGLRCLLWPPAARLRRRLRGGRNEDVSGRVGE